MCFLKYCLYTSENDACFYNCMEICDTKSATRLQSIWSQLPVDTFASGSICEDILKICPPSEITAHFTHKSQTAESVRRGLCPARLPGFSISPVQHDTFFSFFRVHLICVFTFKLDIWAWRFRLLWKLKQEEWFSPGTWNQPRETAISKQKKQETKQNNKKSPHVLFFFFVSSELRLAFFLKKNFFWSFTFSATIGVAGFLSTILILLYFFLFFSLPFWIILRSLPTFQFRSFAYSSPNFLFACQFLLVLSFVLFLVITLGF